VQRVDRHVVRAKVVPDVVARPVRERIDLRDAVQRVVLVDLDCPRA
jgi:hypothetical protein